MHEFRERERAEAFCDVLFLASSVVWLIPFWYELVGSCVRMMIRTAWAMVIYSDIAIGLQKFKGEGMFIFQVKTEVPVI